MLATAAALPHFRPTRQVKFWLADAQHSAVLDVNQNPTSLLEHGRQELYGLQVVAGQRTVLDVEREVDSEGRRLHHGVLHHI